MKNDMSHDEYEKAANYWKLKDADSVNADTKMLMSEIEAFIDKNDTCALATGFGEFVRCTPIEYTYHDSAFWLFTEGGEKFIYLEHNKNVASQFLTNSVDLVISRECRFQELHKL